MCHLNGMSGGCTPDGFPPTLHNGYKLASFQEAPGLQLLDCPANRPALLSWHFDGPARVRVLSLLPLAPITHALYCRFLPTCIAGRHLCLLIRCTKPSLVALHIGGAESAWRMSKELCITIFDTGLRRTLGCTSQNLGS